MVTSKVVWCWIPTHLEGPGRRHGHHEAQVGKHRPRPLARTADVAGIGAVQSEAVTHPAREDARPRLAQGSWDGGDAKREGDGDAHVGRDRHLGVGKELPRG